MKLNVWISVYIYSSNNLIQFFELRNRAAHWFSFFDENDDDNDGDSNNHDGGNNDVNSGNNVNNN